MSASVTTRIARDDKVARALGRRRRGSDRLVRILCWIAAGIGLFFLASILVTLLMLGYNGLSLGVFTHITLPPGSGGGLLNAIVGA